MRCGAWHWAAWDTTHHTYVHITYAAAAPQKQRCSLHRSAAAATSYSGTVQWCSTWYSVVQCGTVWYTRAAPPLTYAAAVWPQLSEEQQQLPRSGRLTHIYISTYLYIYIYVSTETRHRNFSDKIPSVRFNELSIYLLTKSKFKIWLWIYYFLN